MAPFFDKENKMHCRIWLIFGEISDVLEISMFDVVVRDWPFESWLHMQNGNKTKSLSCVLAMKRPFSHVVLNSKYHGNFVLHVGYSKSCHYKYYKHNFCKLQTLHLFKKS